MQLYLWNSFGFFSLLVGFVGIFLPIFPTVPFTIVAAFCFTKGSPRFHDWLIYHPLLGPPIRNWQERRAIPRYAKYLTTIMLSISIPISAYIIGRSLWWLSTLTTVICLAILLWLWLLPDA